MPIDENHSTDLAAPKGEPAPARGWIVALEERQGGLWGKVEWTSAGAQLLTDKAYRHISPVIVHLKDNTVVGLLRASLTNRPNLRGLVALNQETDMDELEQILKALGIKDDAKPGTALAAITALQAASKENNDTSIAALQTVAKTVGFTGAEETDDIIAEVTALQSAMSDITKIVKVDANSALDATVKAVTDLADPTKQVPASAVAALQAQVTELTNDGAKTRAKTIVDKAIEDGKAGVKPLYDHYIARCMKDPDGVQKELDAMPSLTGVHVPTVNPPLKDGEIALNSSQVEVAKLMGISPKALKKTIADEAEETELM